MRSGGRIPGTSAGLPRANIVAGEWEIENVVVAEEFRCQGIGAGLMRSVIAQWEKFGGAALAAGGCGNRMPQPGRFTQNTASARPAVVAATIVTRSRMRFYTRFSAIADQTQRRISTVTDPADVPSKCHVTARRELTRTFCASFGAFPPIRPRLANAQNP